MIIIVATRRAKLTRKKISQIAKDMFKTEKRMIPRFLFYLIITFVRERRLSDSHVVSFSAIVIIVTVMRYKINSRQYSGIIYHPRDVLHKTILIQAAGFFNHPLT